MRCTALFHHLTDTTLPGGEITEKLLPIDHVPALRFADRDEQGSLGLAVELERFVA
jgi:hypothetical protein